MNVMYFDLQIVVFAELSVVDFFRSFSGAAVTDSAGNITSELELPFRIYLSYLTSVAILLLMLSELKEIWRVR